MTRQVSRIALLASLTLLLLASFSTESFARAKKNPYDQVMSRTPELRDFQIPEAVRHELENGMVLYLVEDHDLPLVKLSAMIRAGSIYEPAAKTGLSGLMATVMRSGGSERFPGDELDVRLEGIGARVEMGMGDASGSASMNCLVENLDEVLDIFGDVLRNPAFPSEKLDLAKKQSRSGISRRNDDADGIARREIRKLLYGSRSPYARHSEYDTIEAIEVEDLQAFHQYFYHPNNMILVAGGDFDTQEMIAKVEATFGDWEFVDTFFPPDPVIEDTEASLNYVFKEDVNQSKVRMGHIGIRHDDEHYFPLHMLNEILGGGFSSRLFTRVRSKEELAYSVYAWMVAGDHHPGPFFVGVDTKSESTARAIEIVMEELRRVTTEEVSEAELKMARDALKNSYVFKFSSSYSIARQKARTEFWDKDPDFLKNYLSNLDEVTAADILQAAKERIHPDEMAILVVGREEDFDKPLSELGLGEVTEIDIAIPDPTIKEEEIPEATEATLAEGSRLADAAFMALGGEALLREPASLRAEAEFTIQDTPMGPLSFQVSVYARGESIRQEMKTPFGDMVQIAKGGEGWMISPRGQDRLPADQLSELQDSRRPGFSKLFQEISDYQVQSLESRKLEGKPCELIYLSKGDGDWIRLYLDPETHFPLAKESREKTEAGPALVRELYRDYQVVGGMQIPFLEEVYHNGELFGVTKVSTMEFGVEMEDSLFDLPE
ncbi:MAG: pitrilysin family protein [Candidatus Krumholzibacteria bacterium]|nr:pitrilysin family protein [Candidatus Krumholzibacteria bacterium]